MWMYPLRVQTTKQQHLLAEIRVSLASNLSQNESTNHSVHGCLFNQEDNPTHVYHVFHMRVRECGCVLFMWVSEWVYVSVVKELIVWISMIRGLSSNTNQPTRPISHCDSLPSLLWEWGTEMLIHIDLLFDHGPCRLPFFLPSFLPSFAFLFLYLSNDYWQH